MWVWMKLSWLLYYDRNASCSNKHSYLSVNKVLFLAERKFLCIGQLSCLLQVRPRHLSSFHCVVLPFGVFHFQTYRVSKWRISWEILGAKPGVDFQHFHSHCLCLNWVRGPNSVAKNAEKCVHILCIEKGTGFWVAPVTSTIIMTNLINFQLKTIPYELW